MITFILNRKTISTDAHPGTSLLDFIRYGQNLPGTKIGCREGDCGACTVLEGTLKDEKVQYKSIVSCLTPLGNVQGKHVVTIEGINLKKLSPVQESIVRQSATQCGFCTPGFVMSLTGYCMCEEESTHDKAISAISGNICRCTGYKSIEKAASDISVLVRHKDIQNPIKWMVENNFLPDYFLEIKDRLEEIQFNSEPIKQDVIIGGGTDLMVQQSEEVAETSISFVGNRNNLSEIEKQDDLIKIGSAANVAKIMNSPVMQEYFPGIKKYFKLISSESIRNMGTIAGNFVNASPIGDLSIFFLVLNARLVLRKENNSQKLHLKDFFQGYKQIALTDGEYIESVLIPVPKGDFRFNFEKVSKRTHLDIASVNTAIYISSKGTRIAECSLSAGGVSAIPKYLSDTSTYLMGKEVTPETIIGAHKVLQDEISPISDVRGTADYKRLLLRQLFFAHFIELFPENISLNELLRQSTAP